jgi:aminoglycoside/choline kinase family phosphotransferase
MQPWPLLEQLVRQYTGRATPPDVVPMPGGASTRRFYRVHLGPGSAVAMVIPEADRAGSHGGPLAARGHEPFLEIRALLQQRGVRVPALLADACEDGLILVEDLGDETLEALLSHAPEHRESMYRLAVADLARAQQALDPLPADSLVRTRAFDHTLLRWELDHFREWGLEARGVVLSSSERGQLDEAFSHLVEIIAAWPRGFVHRDYQCRNLMVRRTPGRSVELVWIDFQDALLGPRAYDLVALLSDSYQCFDAQFVAARLDEYAELQGYDAAERRALGREFDLLTVQRKLKDSGRFVFIEHQKRDPSYLAYVEPTLDLVRAALARRSGESHLARLGELLESLLARRSPR